LEGVEKRSGEGEKGSTGELGGGRSDKNVGDAGGALFG